MFGKNSKKEKKKETPPTPVLPNAYAQHASELAGMTPDEILKLLESLGRIDDSITVTRRRADKNGKNSKVVGGRKAKMSVDEAVEYEKKRIEERNEKEKNVRELFKLENEKFERAELDESVYPKRLAPTDIVRCVDAAEQRLEEIDRLRETRKKVYSPREEIVLNILALVKKYEAARVARRIAEKQRQAVLGKSIEELDQQRKDRIDGIQAETAGPSPTPDEIEQKKIEEELEAARTLTGFDKNLRTLVDEAAEIASENPDAAASVMKQWIGNTVNSE